jgi:sterol desaturase/sphingolipid hydroxylase (fatty acid hydroxylase superfamily)
VEDLVTFALLGSYVLFLVLDFLIPARKFPRVARWRGKGIAFFVLAVGLSTAAPLLWSDWMARHRLIDGSRLGVAGGTLVGFVVLELVVYWYHRMAHRVPFLWRWLHQMHHSAERVDIWGALYFHPLEIIAQTLTGGAVLTLVLGLDPRAAVLTLGVLMFYSLFQHANVRTPVWLGHFIQRPEAHSVHHQRGVHAFNYSDFPPWDMLFGTFRNPATWQAEAGFFDGGSQRLGAMLAGRVVEPTTGDAPRVPLAA